MTEQNKRSHAKKNTAAGTETKPETKPEIKQEIRPEIKPAVTAEAKSAVQAAAEAKPEKKPDDLIDKLLESQRLSEERMLAILQANQEQLSRSQQHLSSALDALQSQSERTTDQEQLFLMLEGSKRRREREIDIVIEPDPVFDRKHINRQTDKLFAYCESSYVYFREEPIEADEGPGFHKPRIFDQDRFDKDR